MEVAVEVASVSAKEAHIAQSASSTCVAEAGAHASQADSALIPSSQSTFSGLSQPDVFLSQASSQGTVGDAVEMVARENKHQQDHSIRRVWSSTDMGGVCSSWLPGKTPAATLQPEPEGSADRSRSGDRTHAVAFTPPRNWTPLFRTRSAESNVTASQSSDAATSNHPLSQPSTASAGLEPDSQDSMRSLAYATEQLMIHRVNECFTPTWRPCNELAPSRSRSPATTSTTLRGTLALSEGSTLVPDQGPETFSIQSLPFSPEQQQQQHQKQHQQPWGSRQTVGGASPRPGRRTLEAIAKCGSTLRRSCSSTPRTPRALATSYVSRTPQASSNGVPEEERRVVSTPQPALTSASSAMTPTTPGLRNQMLTPPGAPNFRREERHFEADLRMAIEWCSVPLLSMTLMRNHDPDCSGNHAIHEAIRRAHMPALQFLLAQEPDSIEVPCRGRRPLLRAIQSLGCLPDGMVAVRLLLQARAQPNAVSDDGLEAPLHAAAGKGCPEIVSMLLSHGADSTLALADGRTPLHAACSTELLCFQVESLQRLLAAGCDPRRRDHTGRRPREVFEELTNPLEAVFLSGAPQRVVSAAVAHRGDEETLCQWLLREERWWERKGLVFTRAHARHSSESSAHTSSAGASFNFVQGIRLLPEAVFRSVAHFL